MKYEVKIDVDANQYHVDADDVRSLRRLQFLLEGLLDGLTPMQSENLDNVLKIFCLNRHEMSVGLVIKRKGDDLG